MGFLQCYYATHSWWCQAWTPKVPTHHINMNVKADMWCNIGSIHSINSHQFQSKVIISRSRPIHHVILILPVWSGDHIIDINFI